MSQPKSNEQVLSDIKAKIERESKIIQGFQTLKKNTNNAEVIQRCNNQIRETKSNIDYLSDTLKKMTLQVMQDESPESPRKSKNHLTTSRPIYSRFDLVKYDCPSLGHKIQYMLQQLQFKLQVENQYREANEKISHLYLMDGDRSSSNAAEGGRVESDQRIQLLNKSLKRYQDMHIDVEEVTRDMEIMNTPKYARKPLSGKLNISVTCIRDIDHIASPMFSKRPESLVAIKVDDVEQARTRGSRNGRWSEEFIIDVDKGNEIEFSVYDKSGSALVPVAITWALLSDITEELRKKKVANELGNSDWVSASNLSVTANKSTNENVTYASSSPAGGQQYDNNTIGGGSSASSATLTSNSNNTQGSRNIQITSWLSLEPVGQILVSLSFDKSNQSGNSQFMGALGRHGAIRQKKEEVFEQHGHQFVQKQFYNIMCCALCGEFLRYTGFQCQDCKFLCHKKCYQKVVTKCISKSSNEIDPDEAKLNHRIPHRFEPILNRGTKWCCHCGYILPWGRKNVRKCTECGVMCHAQCTHLVPDFCGMSMEMANKILTTIKSTKAPAISPSNKSTQSPYSNDKIKVDDEIKVNDKITRRPSFKDSGSTSDSKSETLNNLSDDENEKAFRTTRLPTQTTNQHQEQIEAPNNKSSRRPPPDFSKGDLPALPPLQNNYKESVQQEAQQHETPKQYQHQQEEPDYDYTFASSHTEELQPELNTTESKNSTLLQAEDLNNFGYYNNDKTQHLIAPDSENSGTPMVIDSNKDTIQHEEKSHQKSQEVVSQSSHQRSPHKSKRRRRKVGLDDFQFLAVLGKGNFGKVMLAESRHTQNLCAIKVLKKDFIVENDEADSVKSEKRVFLTANREMHPFLLNLHCCFQTENRIYFVMEYISGGDLMWHIQKSRFSAKRAKFYACEVLLALKYFHDNGIVYRDLKLDNILLTTKGHIKIADYGLCKEEMWHEKTTGTFCGTPEFMAPEIIAGKQYDRSVDWWAFGVLLFQMLLCQSPFKGDDEDEIFNAIEHDDVRYPISMPRQTVLVLQALLTKDPINRLGSGKRDAEEIMEHPYFQDIDFEDVFHCRIQAPYLPEISSDHDYSNFDQEFTSETPRLTPVDTVLTSEMQEQFRGFSHISEGAAI